jgi:hypothetical protein
MARSMGLDSCPWYLLTVVVLWIYIILTIMACYYRADFLNATICVVSFYMVNEPHQVKKWTFRLLVVGILLSIIYDVLYFLSRDTDPKRIQGADVSWMISFGYYVTIISFFFKFFVALVFWKDSIDFNRIIKRQQNEVPNRFADQVGSPKKDDDFHRRGAKNAIADF